MTLPRSVGGQGRSYHDTVIVIEEMAKACATMGRITVEANMGAIGAIGNGSFVAEIARAAEPCWSPAEYSTSVLRSVRSAR
jgi:alkylation response protein AidB-like acyl-CoA dehydrogenase